ncbi:MAG: flagellar biosynthesis anti-sigma factor FlgM [Bryobacteraceae bacterium]
MKIQNTNVQPPQPDAKTKAVETQEAAKAARAAYLERSGGSKPVGGSSASTDEVSLSSLSQQVRVNQPDAEEREAKIGALAAVVASGSYEIDPLQLSRSIIAESEQAGF